jgi:hypothetical protein
MQQQNANTEPAPQQPIPATQPVGAAKTNQPVVSEEIISIRRLAGI